MEIQFIPVQLIVEDVEQPRKSMDQEALQGLADSIKQHGLLQPLLVRPLHNVNMYQVVVGERRWRAAQLAGMYELPCIVRDVASDEIVTDQLIENMQREDLQPFDKAKALTKAKELLALTNKELASRLGISERMLSYTLELLNLPEDIANEVESRPNRPSDGAITPKHARYLTQLNDEPELQTQVVEKIKAEKLNTDDTARLVKAMKDNPEHASDLLRSPKIDWAEWINPELSPVEGYASNAQPTQPPAVPMGAMTAPRSADELVRDAIMLVANVEGMEMNEQTRVETIDTLESLKLIIDEMLSKLKGHK
ncbi:MAG: ParB/RepB/Spo0J family partition protein [Armatimonadota bacterium]